MDFRIERSQRPILRGVGSRALSFFAFEGLIIAFSLRTFSQGGNPRDLTLVYLASILPTILLSPATGNLVDRLPGRPLRGAAALSALATLALLGRTSGLASMIAQVVVVAVAHSIISSSWQASFVSIAPRERLTEVMGMSQIANTVVASVTPAVVGLVIGVVGAQWAYLMICVAYVGVLLMSLPATPSGEPEDSPRSEEDLDGAMSGILYLRRSPSAWRLVAILMVCAVFLGATNVVEVFFLRGDLHATPVEFGVAAASWPVGALAGARLVACLEHSIDAHLMVIAAATVTGLAIAAAGLSPNIEIAACVLLIGGAGNGALNVSVSSTIMGSCPSHLRGRVATALGAAANTAIVVSYVTGGAMAAALSPRTIFIAAGVGCAVATLSLGARLVSKSRIGMPAQRGG